MYCTFFAIQKSVRPIVGSAVSFFISATILHHFGLLLDPQFSFFHTRGLGKLALMLAGIIQALCFVSITPARMRHLFWRDAVCWPFRATSWHPFFLFFCVFTLLHAGVLGIYVFYNIAQWVPLPLPDLIETSMSWAPSILPHIIASKKVLIVGFIGTLALAWAEELLFRGLLLQHFLRFMPPFASAIASSFIFSILHDLRNPLNLLTAQWQLGLGLFLLGMLLTYIRLWWGSMAASAGAHAGLVYLKVILRKIPLLPIAAGSPFLFPVDLRESLLVHVLMVLGCWLLARQANKTTLE